MEAVHRAVQTSGCQAGHPTGPRRLSTPRPQLPPILSLVQAAELAGLKPGTLKRNVSEVVQNGARKAKAGWRGLAQDRQFSA